MCYSDNRSNSRANTCNKPRLLEGMHLLDKRLTRARPLIRWLMITRRIARPLCRRRIIQISALSTFDGRIGAYHGGDGWRRIRVRFRRGSLRNGYHIYGRQQARKLPNPDTGRQWQEITTLGFLRSVMRIIYKPYQMQLEGKSGASSRGNSSSNSVY